jgi:hypothetical protein
VAELAAALAEAMDYSAEDVDSVRRTAWYHLLSVPQRFREEAPPPLAVVQTCVASVREWLIRLGPDEPADSGSSPRSPEAPRPREAEIIGLAEFLEDRLLGLSPKHRPPWPELIQEMASAETGFDPDVAAAFFTLLVRGRFGAGTRRVKLSAEDVHELTKSLGRLARMDAPPTPAGRLARRFLAVLKESEARQG